MELFSNLCLEFMQPCYVDYFSDDGEWVWQWGIWSNFDHSLIHSREQWMTFRVSYLPWLATANHTLCS